MQATTRGRLPGVLLLVAFVISQLGFCLAVPAFRGIDEFDHAFRASSVGNGHWWAGNREPDDGRGYLIAVDQSIAEAAFEACDDLFYTRPDNCTAVSEPNAKGEVDIASAAATYNPSWYAITGLVSRPFSGDEALYAMRITSMILVDLLLGFGLILARSARNPLWMSGGLMIACTPIVAYSSTLAAPNGVTYAAGALLWMSLLRLWEEAEPGPVIWCGIATGTSVVMLTHSTGILFAFLIALSASPLLWRRLRHLTSGSRRSAIAVATLTGLIGLACLAWILAAGTNDPRAAEANLGQMPLSLVIIGPVLWGLQSIATLAFRDQLAPISAYAFGASAAISLVIIGFGNANRSHRRAMGLAIIFSLLVPLTATFLTYSALGAAWQGRYGLPLSVGVILLAVHACGLVGATKRSHPLVGVFLVVMITAHVITIGAVVGNLNGPLSAFQLIALVFGGILAAMLAVRATTLLGREVAEHA